MSEETFYITKALDHYDDRYDSIDKAQERAKEIFETIIFNQGRPYGNKDLPEIYIFKAVRLVASARPKVILEVTQFSESKEAEQC